MPVLDERRKVYLSCTRFLNGHFPTTPKERLLELAETTEARELSDYYGSGPIIEEFESTVASLLGKEAAVFMPSGSMAQPIAMRIWCDRKNLAKIGLHPTSHLELHEQHGYHELHRLTAEMIGSKTRVLSHSDFEVSTGDYAAAIIELPHREIGGVLPDWSELVAMSAYCRDRKIALHLDGARLWESAHFYQKSYAEICALFDSVYVSFYKGLGGITGAMLLNDRDFVEEAKIWQRRQGGNLYQMFPYVISARDGFRKRLGKMPAYHAKALEIAKALEQVSGLTVTPKVPHTNMMHVVFDREASQLEAAFSKIAKAKRIGLFYKLVPLEPDDGRLARCRAEISIGDAALELPTPLIAELIDEAIRDAT